LTLFTIREYYKHINKILIIVFIGLLVLFGWNRPTHNKIYNQGHDYQII
jgi:predicted negative regulator of RcsB-dependent stress response